MHEARRPEQGMEGVREGTGDGGSVRGDREDRGWSVRGDREDRGWRECERTGRTGDGGSVRGDRAVSYTHLTLPTRR